MCFCCYMKNSCVLKWGAHCREHIISPEERTLCCTMCFGCVLQYREHCREHIISLGKEVSPSCFEVRGYQRTHSLARSYEVNSNFWNVQAELFQNKVRKWEAKLLLSNFNSFLFQSQQMLILVLLWTDIWLRAGVSLLWSTHKGRGPGMCW